MNIPDQEFSATKEKNNPVGTSSSQRASQRVLASGFWLMKEGGGSVHLKNAKVRKKGRGAVDFNPP